MAAYQRIDDIHRFRPDEAGDLEFLLFHQDGVVSRRQALRYLCEKAIRHRLASGRWFLAHRAVYVTHAGPVSEHQRRWIAALAVGRGRAAPLAGLSALAGPLDDRRGPVGGRTDRSGRRYRDVHFDRWGVHVEIDGGQHMDVKAWYADMRQHNESAIAGERLLRFPGWALRQRPDEVLAGVRAALSVAGWRPDTSVRGENRPDRGS
ncbi:hypothetical protein RB614_07115 [Phytohabitans sp. ZYX-F-186]|uniref:DUF559 domain-containing protein n=1 Tax=Phytohabitans maris TaxID=3071409 RepID=A0ABU0ZB48_9ACTN|nr:hypothetical protein [Phytohabitans sp. ZYX-F-186]MDQ7904291.1 hypothetical protein [Phytohabitans sp. ZYX-F-186]